MFHKFFPLEILENNTTSKSSIKYYGKCQRHFPSILGKARGFSVRINRIDFQGGLMMRSSGREIMIKINFFKQ